MEIQGWFNFQKIYEDAVKQFPSGSTFVEVGCWLGRSTSYLANKIKKSNKKIHLICVDTWKGCPYPRHGSCQNLYTETLMKNNGNIFPIFKKNLIEQDLFDVIIPLQGSSVSIAKMFPPQQIDFIFIDAAHDYESVKEDILSWKPKMKNRSIMAGHDIWMTQVHQAVKEQFSNFKVKGTSWIVNSKLKIM
jgi:predicted O-methyltransferase YrrM